MTCPRSQLFSERQERVAFSFKLGAPNSRASGVRHVSEMRGDQRGCDGWGEEPPGRQPCAAYRKEVRAAGVADCIREARNGIV